MSRNPHPDAGKPAVLLNIGAEWVCIPCTIGSRRKASVASFDGQRRISAAIMSAHRLAGRRKTLLWACVADLFGVGSTTAQEMCMTERLNPFEYVTSRKAPKRRTS
jgi:hypothetical protein